MIVRVLRFLNLTVKMLVLMTLIFGKADFVNFFLLILALVAFEWVTGFILDSKINSASPSPPPPC